MKPFDDAVEDYAVGVFDVLLKVLAVTGALSKSSSILMSPLLVCRIIMGFLSLELGLLELV